MVEKEESEMFYLMPVEIAFILVFVVFFICQCFSFFCHCDGDEGCDG
jgi:hypothetical protein